MLVTQVTQFEPRLQYFPHSTSLTDTVSDIICYFFFLTESLICIRCGTLLNHLFESYPVQLKTKEEKKG